MKESPFWGKIKENLKIDFIGRIENELAPGWPDVHFMDNGHSGWIELKTEEKLPKRIDFEPAQPIWLDRYWNLGGTCYVMLHVKLTNEIFIWPGSMAMRLNVVGGVDDCEPLLQVQMNTLGWQSIYDLFSDLPYRHKRTG